jgi:glycosyltransferase involved in cell wall biosynthesis
MKVAFFQPYLANWRIEFLEFFIDKYTMGDVVIYDGGFGGKNDTKSVSGNNAGFKFKKLFSMSPILTYNRQEYPFYFSPFLFFDLLMDKPDVIVTEGEINFINNFSIYLYCRLFKKRYVWWSLGKVRTRKKNLINKLLDPFVDFLLKRSACVMARNTLAKDYYIGSKGIQERNVIVAPNSMNHHKESHVDHDKLTSLKALKGSSKVMLYVGALTKSKRPEDLIYALKKIRTNNDTKDLRLWFVGDGPERDSLERLVDSQGLHSSVFFFGKVFEGVGNYFSIADFVVVPGLGGLVINHAMIYGRPVVSRLADGTELDLIEDGYTGYLVEGYDLDTLVDKISLLAVSDLELMSKHCLNKVRNHWNIDIMYERVLECIQLKS